MTLRPSQVHRGVHDTYADDTAVYDTNYNFKPEKILQRLRSTSSVGGVNSRYFMLFTEIP